METELEQLSKENTALRNALTPSGETKYVHIGEYKFVETFYQPDCESDEININVTVPWPTVKEIMAAILKHANARIAMDPEGSEVDKVPHWEDRMGGQFTREEIDEANANKW